MRSRRIMGSRLLRVGAVLGLGLAVSTAGTAAASPAARSVPSTDCKVQGITWQNNHNSRYLEIKGADTDPGANVDVYPGNCTPAQMWIPILDGVESFVWPISEAVDAWSFDNYYTGYCVQDPGGVNVQVYSEPCVFGDQQEFAEDAGSGSYWLISNAGNADMICERYSGSTDWAIIIPRDYPDWGTDKCSWH